MASENGGIDSKNIKTYTVLPMINTKLIYFYITNIVELLPKS